LLSAACIATSRRDSPGSRSSAVKRVKSTGRSWRVHGWLVLRRGKPVVEDRPDTFDPVAPPGLYREQHAAYGSRDVHRPGGDWLHRLHVEPAVLLALFHAKCPRTCVGRAADALRGST